MVTKKYVFVGVIVGLLLVIAMLAFSDDGGQAVVVIDNQDRQIASIGSPSLTYNNVTLTDHTVYHANNTCTASNLNMHIQVNPCEKKVYSGMNIEQDVSFHWTGISDQDTSWVFVYEGEIESGSMDYYNPNVSHQETIQVPQEQWVSNYLIKDVSTYDNMGAPIYGMCDLGTENNSMMFNVTHDINNIVSNTMYCFSSQTGVNATAFRISGNATVQVNQNVQVQGTWLNAPIKHLGNDLLGNGFSYYQVQNVTFYPNRKILTKWKYTPENRTKKGKWHILGYEGEGITGLMGALQNENYIYMDPAWDTDLGLNLEAVFLFDRSSGDVENTLDGTKNATNNGADRGITSKTVDMKDSFDFENGDSDSVSLPTNFGLFDNDFTVMFDYKQESAVSAPYVYFDGEARIAADRGAGSYDMRFEIDGAGAAIMPTGNLNNDHWYRVFLVCNGTNHIVIDGNQTFKGSRTPCNPSGSATSSKFMESQDGLADNLYLWNVSLTHAEMQQLVNDGDSLVYKDAFVPTGDFLVTLTEPEDASLTNSVLQNFSANQSASGQYNHTNATLTVWNSTYDVVNSTFVSLSSNGTRVLTFNSTQLPAIDGTYDWNVYGCFINFTSDAVCNNSYNGNFSLELDISSPEWVLETPPQDVFVEGLPANMTFNFSQRDANPDSCWYYTSDDATNKTFTCGLDYEAEFLTAGNKTIFFYANDTLGAINSTSATAEIGFYATSQSADTAGEGTEITFTLQINKTDINLETIAANLIFDSTYYQPTSIDTSNPNSSILTTQISIPDGSGSPNGTAVYWNWTFNITNIQPTSALTTTKNITIFSVEIDDCTTYEKQILNLTLVDEATRELVNVTAGSTIELDLTLTSLEDSQVSWIYSNTWTNDAEALVCIPYGLVNDTTYRIDFVSEYSSTDRVTEFFYLDNGTLDNTEIFNSLTNHTIYLYDLATADSTTFLFSFLDESNLEVPNAVVHTFRQYIGSGVFREVERSKQDNNGETHVHLVEEDVIYYFIISEDSEVLFTSSSYNAKCLSDPCSIELEASSEFQEFGTEWDLMPNGQFSVTEDADNRQVSLTFSATTPTRMNLTVAKQDYTGDVEVIDGGQTTATSGTITVTVPQSAGNTTYYAIVYREDDYIAHSIVDFRDKAAYYGNTGKFMGFLIVVALVLMGATEGILLFVFVIFALIVVSVMALINLGYYALMGFISAIAIVVWKLIKRGRRVV